MVIRMTRVDVYAKVKASEDERPDRGSPVIGYLKFPFNLKKDQEEAVEAWIRNDFRGSIIYRYLVLVRLKLHLSVQDGRREQKRELYQILPSILTLSIISTITIQTKINQLILTTLPPLPIISDVHSKMIQMKVHSTNLFHNLGSCF